MSFVGTRPEVTKYVKKYTKEIVLCNICNYVCEGSVVVDGAMCL